MYLGINFGLNRYYTTKAEQNFSPTVQDNNQNNSIKSPTENTLEQLLNKSKKISNSSLEV